MARGAPFEDFEVEHDFPSIGTRVMLLNARVIREMPERTRQLVVKKESQFTTGGRHDAVPGATALIASIMSSGSVRPENVTT